MNVNLVEKSFSKKEKKSMLSNMLKSKKKLIKMVKQSRYRIKNIIQSVHEAEARAKMGILEFCDDELFSNETRLILKDYLQLHREWNKINSALKFQMEEEFKAKNSGKEGNLCRK